MRPGSTSSRAVANGASHGRGAVIVRRRAKPAAMRTHFDQSGAAGRRPETVEQRGWVSALPSSVPVARSIFSPRGSADPANFSKLSKSLTRAVLGNGLARDAGSSQMPQSESTIKPGFPEFICRSILSAARDDVTGPIREDQRTRTAS